MTDNKYKTTIGLEIHAELKTRTKMFCDSKNDPNEKNPNVNICPVCMGHPGTLPVINKEAVKHVLRVGAALGGEIADFTEFDRKNYFYPDIPKGYQISQYKYPLIKGGKLAGTSLTRIHLEEDTASSMHLSSLPQNIADVTQNHAEKSTDAFLLRPSASSPRESATLVDFNRAGVPLMELVTEPEIHSAEQAAIFAKELQLLLRYLGAGDANMEKGEMRVEANVSVAKEATETAEGRGLDPSTKLGAGAEGRGKLGTKVEIKNLNSFRAVQKAIEFEVKRHIELLESGEKIIQETRGWDEKKEVTFSQRMKEESHDYRYFPDPDLPKLKLSKIPEFSPDVLKESLPELPWERRERYVKDFGIKIDDAEMYVRSEVFSRFFEEVVDALNENKDSVKLASNYIASDIAGLMKSGEDEVKEWLSKEESPKAFSKLILMASEGKISSRGAKDILALIIKEGGDPEKIAEEKNLLQKSDEGELKAVVQKVIEENPKVVEEYKSGKESVLQFLVGQGMKATKGSANPEVLKKVLVEELK